MPRASYSRSALRVAPLRCTTSLTFIGRTINPAPWGRVKSQCLTPKRHVSTLQILMTSRISSVFLVAVAVLVVMGHICAGPFHAHAGSVTTHSEDHHERGGDDAAHGASCEVLRATATIDLPALPVVRLDIPALTLSSTASTRPLPAPGTSPPLFLLHDVLLI